MLYTWKCKGCGKQGTRTFQEYDKAQEAGYNHQRGRFGKARGVPIEVLQKCQTKVIEVRGYRW